MIFWSADERDGALYSVDRVRQCDLLILIVAHRYGYIPANSQFSVTEMEYRAARNGNIPVIAFFVDETIPWPPNLVEWEKRPSLEQFKVLVESEVTRKLFKTPDELFALVTQAMVGFWERFHREASAEHRHFSSTVPIDLPVQIKAKPDATIYVGIAEDALPLVLQIKRPKDLISPLDQLAKLVTRGQSG
jgi:hypothetical protein